MNKIQCESCKTKLCASKVPIFFSLNREHLTKVVSKINHLSFNKGEAVCIEGDYSNALVIINQGQVKLTKVTKEGKEQIIRVLSSGDFFGELSIFNEKDKYNFSAYALSSVKICSLSKESMNSILLENPEISIKILTEVSKRLMEAENLAQNLATNDADIRVASLIAEFGEKFGHNTDLGIEVNLPMNREDMANYIGVTRETISRKLTKLQDSGAISLVGNKTLIIRDPNKLNDFL
ncbi:Crp/Fnr family transcriptional regulator [Clostridium manihotivorum]|uniref:Crp/Fnr family transcriptional regulator n=1 Tax=Clostridium manihotivorum TaxID=2320868 RepID=A0A3R5TIG8_9CLOT|nr:Crp/Fnr family transcriptional regulator [Clostridium manihotivorum]QAA34251.1 Crp/Fnr family transcriptional regulator [Clostridium manihotivorum]